jgi:hypothetical protein
VRLERQTAFRDGTLHTVYTRENGRRQPRQRNVSEMSAGRGLIRKPKIAE